MNQTLFSHTDLLLLNISLTLISLCFSLPCKVQDRCYLPLMMFFCNHEAEFAFQNIHKESEGGGGGWLLCDFPGQCGCWQGIWECSLVPTYSKVVPSVTNMQSAALFWLVMPTARCSSCCDVGHQMWSCRNIRLILPMWMWHDGWQLCPLITIILSLLTPLGKHRFYISHLSHTKNCIKKIIILQIPKKMWIT